MLETDVSSRRTLQLPLHVLSREQLLASMLVINQRLSGLLTRISSVSVPDAKSVRRCCTRLSELAKELEARNVITSGQGSAVNDR